VWSDVVVVVRPALSLVILMGRRATATTMATPAWIFPFAMALPVALAIAGCPSLRRLPEDLDGGGDGGAIDGAGADRPPVACGDGGVCPGGTVCGPSSLCVDCSVITASLPATPALARPMRGAYTGSLHAPAALATLRPTFTWRSVAPTCGALTYQIQADDSCTPGNLDTCPFATPELDAEGVTTTSHAPSQDLKVSTAAPVGAFYAWRVRACDASQRCSAWSEVRYLHVGRVREDINGDGYGDLLAGGSDGIEVYLGSSQFDPSDATTSIPYSSGISASFVGDVNGDGYADFFGTLSYAPTGGYVPTVFFGASSIATMSKVSLTKTAGGPSTIIQTNSAGDFNGDGFGDLIVQWGYSTTTPQNELRLFLGGTTFANTPDLSIPGPFVSDYTLQHSGRIGDVNGDGYEDVALSAMSDGGTNGGLVRIFAGGPAPGISRTADIVTIARAHEVLPAGDVDGDGYDDALMVLSGTSFSIYKGAASLPTTFFKTWPLATASSGVGGFDIDRDGFMDFVVGATSSTSLPVLYRGANDPVLVPNGLMHLNFSTIVATSDHDGDGRPDFVSSSGFTGTSAQVMWMGSDGTTNPRSFQVRLSDPNATLNGNIVR
jgi:hypothetical protein